MANRSRTNPVQFYLSDDEQYILTTKFKASGMKSMSTFLRKACTWAGRDNYNYHKGINEIIQKLKCLFMKRLGQIIRKWAKSPTLSYRLCYNLPWVVTPKIELNTKQTVVKTEHFTAVFLYPFLGRTWLNGKQKPHQSGVILSQRWWAVHSHYQLQSIRHEKHVSLFTQGMYLSRQG